jgi:hypothetical protein
MARWELQRGEDEIMRLHPSMRKLFLLLLVTLFGTAVVHRPDLPEPRDHLDRHEPPADRGVGVFNQSTVSVGLERVRRCTTSAFWDRIIGSLGVNAGDGQPVVSASCARIRFRDALRERRRTPASCAAVGARRDLGTHRSSSRRLLPVYATASSGPFGGGDARAALRTSRTASTSVGLVAASITAHGAVREPQLFSGTIAERVGGGKGNPHRLRGLRARLAPRGVRPDIGTFIRARALTGTANAFLTPILLTRCRRSFRRGARPQRRHVRRGPVSGLTFAPAVGGAIEEVSGASFISSPWWRSLAVPQLELVGIGNRPRARLRGSSTAGSGCSRATR